MRLILPKIVAIGIYDMHINFPNTPVTPKRKTAMFEIEIPIEDGGIAYTNHEAVPITTDLVVCAKPGQERHTKGPFKCYYIHMELREGDLYDILTSLPTYIKTDKKEEYARIFQQMCACSEIAVEEDEILLHSLVLQLVHLLLTDSKRHNTRLQMKGNNYVVIERVLNYIQENLSSDLSLEAVSSFAGFSPVHFHKLFFKATGRTLREYVEGQRIKKAMQLLLSTKMNLTQIAYECGFASQSHFSYVFKRKMNVTPREYVRNVSDRYNTPPHDDTV